MARSPYSSLEPSCLCHEDYLIEVLVQMLPTQEEMEHDGIWLDHPFYQPAREARRKAREESGESAG